MITTGIHHTTSEPLILRDQTVSNRDAPVGSMQAHAAVVVEGDGPVEIDRCRFDRPQRALLWYAHRNNPKYHTGKRWLTGSMERCWLDGFSERTQRSNTSESIVFHARVGPDGNPDYFPHQTGVEDFTIRNFGATNRPRGSLVSIWGCKVKRLTIAAVSGPGIVDIGLWFPIERLIIRDVDTPEVRLRLRNPNMTPDHIGDIDVDDRYRITVYDQRKPGTPADERSYAGEFDHVEQIRDWLADHPMEVS